MYDTYTLVLGFTDENGDFADIVERMLYFDDDATLWELADRVNEIIAEEKAKNTDMSLELTAADLYCGVDSDPFNFDDLQVITLL